ADRAVDGATPSDAYLNYNVNRLPEYAVKSIEETLLVARPKQSYDLRPPVKLSNYLTALTTRFNPAAYKPHGKPDLTTVQLRISRATCPDQFQTSPECGRARPGQLWKTGREQRLEWWITWLRAPAFDGSTRIRSSFRGGRVLIRTDAIRPVYGGLFSVVVKPGSAQIFKDTVSVSSGQEARNVTELKVTRTILGENKNNTFTSRKVAFAHEMSHRTDRPDLGIVGSYNRCNGNQPTVTISIEFYVYDLFNVFSIVFY
ncbi:unnamed protein product, partial [Nesidiocoris tenuis]